MLDTRIWKSTHWTHWKLLPRNWCRIALSFIAAHKDLWVVSQSAMLMNEYNSQLCLGWYLKHKTLKQTAQSSWQKRATQKVANRKKPHSTQYNNYEKIWRERCSFESNAVADRGDVKWAPEMYKIKKIDSSDTMISFSGAWMWVSVPSQRDTIGTLLPATGGHCQTVCGLFSPSLPLDKEHINVRPLGPPCKDFVQGSKETLCWDLSGKEQLRKGPGESGGGRGTQIPLSGPPPSSLTLTLGSPQTWL